MGLLAYNLLSPVALAVLVVLTAGLWPGGTPVTAATCVLFSGLFVAALLSMSASSSGVLLLLFLPIYFCIALFPFDGLGVFVHWLRGRKMDSVGGRTKAPADPVDLQVVRAVAIRGVPLVPQEGRLAGARRTDGLRRLLKLLHTPVRDHGYAAGCVRLPRTKLQGGRCRERPRRSV